MMNFKIIRILVGFLLLISMDLHCQTSLREGVWRGAFVVRQDSIPFLFKVIGKGDDVSFVLVNGKENVELKPFYKKDSVYIPVEIYDAVIKGRITGNKVTGVFKKFSADKPDPGIPFIAKFGKQPRFKNQDNSTKNFLDGKWDISFTYPNTTDSTVGVFEQKGNYLTGTIMTTTGDYRYLEGSVGDGNFHLSAFSGSNPILFKGTFINEAEVEGELVNIRGNIKFKGKRNDKASLPDAYSLTYLKEGFTTLDFTFPDLNGKPVSIRDDKYKNKVVVVTILGSWCPNCIDETSFLSPWYKENKDRGVEIIGLAFERKEDPEYAKKILGKLIDRFDVEYDILFAGLANKEAASQSLPALNAVLSFPTTILFDKKGNVRKIHTGYTGPATGKYYDEFVKEFNHDIDQLLNETVLPYKSQKQ